MTIRRVLTEPPWSSRPSNADELVLRGRTRTELWGFGQHPSTSLCLSVLAGIYSDSGPRPRSAIELLCGSGLLCIAANLLGAQSAIGIEPDAATRAIAEENARLNLSTAQFSRDEEQGSKSFDLAIANLSAKELIASGETLARFVPRGHLLAAGYIEDEREQLEQSFLARGFRLLYREEREGFIATVFKGRAGERRGQA